jgi:hypothetical protein
LFKENAVGEDVRSPETLDLLGVAGEAVLVKYFDYANTYVSIINNTQGNTSFM